MQPSVAIPRITTHLGEFTSDDHLAVGQRTHIKNRSVDAGCHPAPLLVECAVWLQSRDKRILLAINGGELAADDDAAVLLHPHRVNNIIGTHARRESRISGTIRIQPSDLAERGIG